MTVQTLIVTGPRKGSRGQQLELQLPANTPIYRVVDQLVRLLGLRPVSEVGEVPLAGHGRVLPYWLIAEGRPSDCPFPPGKTLAECGVRDGDRIHLCIAVYSPATLTLGEPDTPLNCGPTLMATPCPTPEAGVEDPVDCTVFAPPEASRGDAILVQVYAHQPYLSRDIAATASEFDAHGRRRGVTSLRTSVRRGTSLTFELSVRELSVPEPVTEIVWHGTWGVVTFEVEVPPDARIGSHVGTVFVCQDTVPIGRITFRLDVVSEAKGHRWTDATGEARRYELAFISYASQDRDEVLRCVRVLPAAGIRFWQDVLDLEPGDRWWDEIRLHIDDSDVMFLFWSTAAKQSEWVGKEWRYALDHKGDEYIRPVIIEGPPPVPPPSELKHLHFNDRVAYFIKATEAGRPEAG